MQEFGGDWTKIKIDIVYKYACAYLQIMKSKPYPLLYFDGFAGTGEIISEGEKFDGTAKQILKIEKPKSFDIYYFVELDAAKATELNNMIITKFSHKENVYVVKEDCNQKLIDLSKFLKSDGKNYRVLAFIDPFGMELKWASIESLAGCNIDLWILVPTGVGPNRLLTKKGNISEAWWNKLETFLGIDKEQIKNTFYKKSEQIDLFEKEILRKEKNSIEKLHNIYKDQLLSIFQFVSDAFILKNKTNSSMFHFLLTSNNKTAIKIANDIIRQYR